jgi:hypothetical protein
VLSYLSRLLSVVRTVSRNPGLLRVELAFVGFNVAECSHPGQPRWLRLDKVVALAAGSPHRSSFAIAPRVSVAGRRCFRGVAWMTRPG